MEGLPAARSDVCFKTDRNCSGVTATRRRGQVALGANGSGAFVPGERGARGTPRERSKGGGRPLDDRRDEAGDVSSALRQGSLARVSSAASPKRPRPKRHARRELLARGRLARHPGAARSCPGVTCCSVARRTRPHRKVVLALCLNLAAEPRREEMAPSWKLMGVRASRVPVERCNTGATDQRAFVTHGAALRRGTPCLCSSDGPLMDDTSCRNARAAAARDPSGGTLRRWPERCKEGPLPLPSY
jgi:hypothetical protein